MYIRNAIYGSYLAIDRNNVFLICFKRHVCVQRLLLCMSKWDWSGCHDKKAKRRNFLRVLSKIRLRITGLRLRIEFYSATCGSIAQRSIREAISTTTTTLATTSSFAFALALGSRWGWILQSSPQTMDTHLLLLSRLFLYPLSGQAIGRLRDFNKQLCRWVFHSCCRTWRLPLTSSAAPCR